jgi:hypothetical protein
VALLGLLALSSSATAISIDLVWSGSGTSMTGTDFVGSEAVTLGVYATFTVPPGFAGVAVSVSYDPAALSLSECVQDTTGQLVSGANFIPIPASTCKISSGIAGSMNQQVTWVMNYSTGNQVLAFPTADGTVHIANITFHVTGAVGGNTVLQSFFHPLFDGWHDNNSVFSLNAVFGSAMAYVPEPATAILVGVGLISLIATGRRMRRG